MHVLQFKIGLDYGLWYWGGRLNIPNVTHELCKVTIGDDIMYADSTTK